MREVKKRKGISETQLLALGKDLKALHRRFAERRVRGVFMTVAMREQKREDAV